MKYLSIIRYTLLAVSVLSVLLYFVGAIDIDFMLRWAYILLGVAAVSALLFPVFNIVQNPKGAVGSLIGLTIVVVVVGISYSLGSAEPMVLSDGTILDNVLTLKLSDTGLFATYAAMVVTMLAIVVGELSNMFK